MPRKSNNWRIPRLRKNRRAQLLPRNPPNLKSLSNQKNPKNQKRLKNPAKRNNPRPAVRR